MSEGNQYTRKRKRIENQIQGSFLTPSPKVKGVKIKFCNIIATCPGTNEVREVGINIVDNKYKFRCNCGKYENEEIESCKHINSIFIKMLQDYIDNAVKYEEKKDNFLALSKDLKSLMNDFDKINITNKEEIKKEDDEDVKM